MPAVTPVPNAIEQAIAAETRRLLEDYFPDHQRVTDAILFKVARLAIGRAVLSISANAEKITAPPPDPASDHSDPALTRASALHDADEISERIQRGAYRASLSDVERLRNHVRRLTALIPEACAPTFRADFQSPDANPYQRAARAAYLNGQFLDAADVDALSDQIFAFLMAELSSGEGCDGFEVAISRVENVIRELRAVLQALGKAERDAVDDPSGD